MSSTGKRIDMELPAKKICKSCGKELPISEYTIRPGQPRGRPTCNRCRYDKDKDRAQKIRKLYGISMEDVERLILAQNGACPICNCPLDLAQSGTARPYVDHCHETGIVRGILCHPCNMGLGNFQDSIERLRRAIGYLGKKP